MAKKSAAKQLKITLVRGLANKRDDQLVTVRALGLRRPRHSVVMPDNPAVRGQIAKIAHLLKVEEA